MTSQACGGFSEKMPLLKAIGSVLGNSEGISVAGEQEELDSRKRRQLSLSSHLHTHTHTHTQDVEHYDLVSPL
jgi:hypothetical protein